MIAAGIGAPAGERYVRGSRQSGALPVVRLSARCLRVRRADLDRRIAERVCGVDDDLVGRLVRHAGSSLNSRARIPDSAWAMYPALSRTAVEQAVEAFLADVE